MKHNLAQLELQNLNQQLNPHEFKNMMMVLAPEIQVKAPQAYQHLLRISQLIKAALHQSSITDSLENQLNQIESYLAIEKELLVYPLEWDIKATVPDMNIEIPRLLLKNMVENAVKHGVKNLKSPGKILVEVHQNGHDLHLTIDDNGVGRMQSVAMDSGIGTSTYFKLFETLNAKNKNKARMNILDKEVGTRVEIKIPLDYQY
jgi:LytS/YehU family sensor histidine kinase